jgi:CBS domain-containing protein
MSSHPADSTAFHGPAAAVRTYLTSDVVAVDRTASVRDAAVAIAKASVGVVVIGDPEDVVALVSERDIVRATAEDLDLDTTLARDIGSSELVWIDIEGSIADAAEEMMEDYVRHVLVGDRGQLVGVLSIRDVVAAYIT